MYRRMVLVLSAALLVALAGNAFGQTVPAGGWTEDVTLGSATPGSSVSPQKGTYEVTGNGNDIWDSADAGQYLYKELVGDGSMTARVVDDGEGSSTWAKGGVMVRQSTDTGSTHSFMCMTATDGSGASWQGRLVADSASENSDSPSVVAEPYWVRIERVGDDLSGFTSPDGENWTQMGSARTIAMQDPVLIGLAVTSHAAGELRTFTFDSISFTGEVSGESNPGAASGPSPADEAVDVPRDVVLGWAAGDYPGTHDVYLGTSYDDVNDASRANPMDVLLSQGQSDTTLDAGRLEFGQTYYWRVDEANSVGGAIFKSDVWSFTVEPFAYPVENIIATSNGASAEGVGPEKTVDGSGLDELDQHSVAAEDMWLCTAGADSVYVQYEFDGVYKLHQMLVWNYNVQFEMMLGFGLKDVTVEYSENGADWTVLEEAVFTQATSSIGYAANTVVDFGGVSVKYVKLTVNSGWGFLPVPQYGLSEVRFLYIPASAREPQPVDGAADVSVASVLNWRAGREAASHEVYLSTDEAAVADGTAPVDAVSDASYTPSNLDLDTTYYWKVDEVNEVEAIGSWAGNVWSFSTQAYLVVDDFESYGDDIDAGDAIFLAWIDGYEMPGNGSTVGNMEAPFAEQTIVHNGGQAMPLFYDNAGAGMSEAELALTQNWTTSSVKSLSLYFYGAAGNTGQLYVKINNTKVLYDGAASDIAIAAWQPWNIDLSTVGGNLSNVASLTIGIDGAGAAGVVYVDDVRLYPKTPEYITPVEPSDEGLVAYYAFEGNANDSSGNGNHGTLNGDVQFAAGHDGSALDCDGVNDYVSTGKTASDLGISGNSPRTVTSWVYTRGFANGGIYDVGNRAATQDFSLRTLDGVENSWRVQYWGGDSDFSYNTVDEWVHFTHVHDGTYTKIYANGVLIVDWEKTIDTTDDNPFQIGCYGWQEAYFNGLIDEVRLYNRAFSGGEVLGFLGETTPRHKPF